MMCIYVGAGGHITVGCTIAQAASGHLMQHFIDRVLHLEISTNINAITDMSLLKLMCVWGKGK